MSKPVTFVDVGGQPVTEVTTGGVPVSEVTVGGQPMTRVSVGGMPIINVSGTAFSPCPSSPLASWTRLLWPRSGRTHPMPYTKLQFRPGINREG